MFFFLIFKNISPLKVWQIRRDSVWMHWSYCLKEDTLPGSVVIIKDQVQTATPALMKLQ